MKKSDEKSIRELLAEIQTRLSEESDTLKIKKFQSIENELIVKLREIEKYKENLNKEFDYKREDELNDMFISFNSIVFAGFDYYYINDVGKLLMNRQSLEKEGNNIDILINEDHIEKLKSTIDCAEDFYFVSYDDEIGKPKNAIGYKNTLFGFNLIPFKREEDGSITIEKDDKDITISKKRVKDFVKNSNEEYYDLEYKTLSKHGKRAFK